LEAVTMATDEQETRELLAAWEQRGIPVPLKVLEAPYRDLLRPRPRSTGMGTSTCQLAGTAQIAVSVRNRVAAPARALSGGAIPGTYRHPDPRSR
ncbi:MAG: hypothetical protein WCC38_11540, partial [Pseudonocardiaceae bacterium]